MIKGESEVEKSMGEPEEGSFNFYFTLGLNGISGGIDDIKSVLGFTGLKIRLTDRNAFYLGIALAVSR